MHTLSQTTATTPKQGLVDLETATNLIRSGHILALAGDELLLAQLPKGHWIGGTIPYFMGDNGGETTRNKIFINDLTELGGIPEIRSYDSTSLPNIAKEAPENGFSLIILPAESEVHSLYARNAPEYEDMFLKPIVGWVSGTHLDDLGKTKPKVFDGNLGKISDNRATVIHLTLPENKMAMLDIINMFEQGGGHTIQFTSSGFSATDCIIDNKQQNLAEFLKANEIDTRLPLVADYSGAMINVSIKGVDEESGTVDFYAPVFRNTDYQFAAPIGDYKKDFSSVLPEPSENWIFSCNCILNYLYMELEGKQTGKIIGPITFGEIAFQLLNQTMVYLSVEDV